MEKQIDELIGYRPGWIIRNGNLLFVIFIALFLTALYFIRYPEVIKEPVSIHSDKQASAGVVIIIEASEYFAAQLHTNDTIGIILKEPAAKDSLIMKALVAGAIVKSTNDQHTFTVKAHVLHTNGSKSLLVTHPATNFAIATVLLPQQRLLTKLWQGLKSTFTINSNH